MKKIVALLLVVVMAAMCLTACGETALGAGTYSYAKGVLNASEVETPAYNFGNAAGMFGSMMRAHSVDLTLNDDGTYTMSVHAWMEEDTEGGSVPVGEAFPFGDGMYAEWFSTSEGTYTSTANTITIKAESATFKIPDLGMSYLAQLFGGGNAASGSYAPEGENFWGEWNSTDVPEVLNQFPETTFIIEEGKIVSWVKGGYIHEVASETAVLYFYSDGSVVLRDIANKATQELAWSVDGTTVTVEYSVTNFVQDEAGNWAPVTDSATFTGNADQALMITLNEITNEFALTADDVAALSK